MASTASEFSQSREIRYEYSRDFGSVLQQSGVSLLVSTYQADKLVVLGTNDQGPTISLHNFEQPMGIAVHPDRIAIGTRFQVCLLDNTPELTAQLDPKEQYDSCYLAMRSHFTNDISIHEMAWCGEELWFVNTRFSCLASLEPEYSFVPRWKPPFITELVAEDSCHLNGFCVENGQPRYVTMHAETELSGGWRETKATGGSLVDVGTGNAILGGLAMPHSPRLHADRLWLLESGKGLLLHVDRDTGVSQQVTQQPGFTRGLAFSGKYAFIGLSRIRETAVFGEVPISEHPDELKCAVVAVDLETGQRVAYFEFLSGVEEIFDVQVVETSRNPYISGPLATREGAKTIWYAAAPRWSEGEQGTADD
jgi:uncharacterized protein (TIGR03032 family)